MSFNLSDYVDVAERIRLFSERYPEGTLQSHIDFTHDGVLCVAEAYRTPDDIRPGVGHAFEPIPGKTPYTRDSEVMNAETSAWGRAIVALGFETKKIASAEEVRNRTGPAEVPDSSTSGSNRGGRASNYPKTTVSKYYTPNQQSDDDVITLEQLEQAVAFAVEHGTTWDEAVSEFAPKASPRGLTVGEARTVFSGILDQAVKAAS